MSPLTLNTIGGVASAAPVSDAAAATPAPNARASSSPPTEDQVRRAVEQLNAAVRARDQNLEFSVDQQSGRLVVTLKDASTNEIVRQFPSEEVLSISRAIDRMQGLLLRRSA